MHQHEVDRIDRWTDDRIIADPDWFDSVSRSPITLYRKYLVDRRAWEERAWKVGGSQSPEFGRLLDELTAIHADVSTEAPVETRDLSIVKPPSRDTRTVGVSAVERVGSDRVVIHTLEDEFEGLLPVAYRVLVVRTDGRWRLKERVTDHGQGRRIRRL